MSDRLESDAVEGRKLAATEKSSAVKSAAMHWLRNVARADFVKSLGLYVMRDRVVLVRLRKNFLNLTLVAEETRELPLVESRQAISELTGWVAEDVREIALKAESDSHARALREAIISLLPQLNAARDSLYICVPQEQAIVQHIYFPAAAEANLQQALEYEIERQLPFRRDEIFYDYLPTGKSGDKIGLYLFAIPKKNLAGILDPLQSIGIKPKGVETTATAIANYLLFCKGELADSAAVIGGDDQSWEMVGLQTVPNGFKATHRMLFSHWLPQAVWAQGAAREFLQQCTEGVPNLYAWGEAEKLLGAGNGEAIAYESLVAVSRERLDGKAIAGPSTLLAIGAALRGVREAALETNFLRSQETGKRRTRALSVVNLLLACMLVLALAAWGVSYPIRDELRLRQLQGENQKLAPALTALRQQEAELQKATKELNFLSSLEQRKGEVLRVLDELSKIVPSSAYLSNLRLRDRILEVQGNAENASALIPLLERSSLFENVGFNAPSNRGRDNRETFSLKAEIEKSKAGKVTAP
jgi:Tfp pilus assembly protein PilN